MASLMVGAVVSAALLASVLVGVPAEAGDADAAGASLRSVGIIGDSIAKESEAHIRSVLSAQGRPVAHLNVSNSVTIDDIRASTIAAVERADGPDILVLVLGTAQANDYWPFARTATAVGTKWAADLRGLLQAVAPSMDCIRVFDIQERDTGFYLGVDRHASEMNAATRRVAAEFGNVEYFHYSAWVDRTGPAYDLGDHLHHNTAGRWAVGRLVRDAANGCDPATATAPFWDIRPGYWARDEIAWMASEGLATGFDNGSFRAEIGEFKIPVTRGQAINMLWHQAGAPNGAAAHGWSDGMAWLQGALDWAWSEGVASGFPDGTFRQASPIARAELARMIWERAGSPAAATTHTWVDGQRWVNPALDWIAETGLMTGWPDATFRPDKLITRAQIARLLFRFDQLNEAAPAASADPDTETPDLVPSPSLDLSDPTTTTVPTTIVESPTSVLPATPDPEPGT